MKDGSSKGIFLPRRTWWMMNVRQQRLLSTFFLPDWWDFQPILISAKGRCDHPQRMKVLIHIPPFCVTCGLRVILKQWHSGRAVQIKQGIKTMQSSSSNVLQMTFSWFFDRISSKLFKWKLTKAFTHCKIVNVKKGQINTHNYWSVDYIHTACDFIWPFITLAILLCIIPQFAP